MNQNTQNTILPILLTQKQAADYLGTTVGCLNTWRAQGKNPIPFIRWGNRIRYRMCDLDQWIAENMVPASK